MSVLSAEDKLLVRLLVERSREPRPRPSRTRCPWCGSWARLGMETCEFCDDLPGLYPTAEYTGCAGPSAQAPTGSCDAPSELSPMNAIALARSTCPGSASEGRQEKG